MTVEVDKVDTFKKQVDFRLVRTAAAPIRFDPVIAARVVAPWTPDAGEID